jgi:hypothetical protein
VILGLLDRVGVTVKVRACHIRWHCDF